MGAFLQSTAKDDIVTANSILCGESMNLCGYMGKGMLLGFLRVLLEDLGERFVLVHLVTVEGGVAIRADVFASYGSSGTPRRSLEQADKEGGRYWLVSEHSRQLRVFKRTDTALSLCRELGLKSVVLDLDLQPADDRAEAA